MKRQERENEPFWDNWDSGTLWDKWDMGQEKGKSKKVKGKKLSAILVACGFFLLLTAYCLPATVSAQTRDFTRHVNPFIGTGGHGHTFPGATMPFGMVQPSPDTRIDNWDGSSGYHYSDDIIYGFSHTHLSGTGIPDGCDILFMPTVGQSQFFAKEGDKSVNGYGSKFSHANEKAEPGYYSVKLDDDGILAEMTATARVGFHRYTFPKTDKANIIIDLKWRDKALNSQITFAGKNRIEGFRESSSWAKNQKVYFAVESSKAFRNASIQYTDPRKQVVYDLQKIRKSKSSETIGGSDLVTALDFDDLPGRQLLLKVAISYVSIEGARANLKSELPHWDFDKVRADAKAAWNKELSKIEVSGGTPEQTTNFYTALYHTMIQPNVFNDVDGRYKGHDGKIHQLPGYAAAPLAERRSSASPDASDFPRGSAAAPDGRRSRDGKGGPRKSTAFPLGGKNRPEHYTVFSLWDTFRAAHPLYTIIDQKRTVDFINSFIRIYEQGGRLPVWELWGEETDTMIGYHAVSVIADAMAKGIKGFDYEKAYAAAKHSAELDHFGLAAYKKRGYISMEDENESVSRTLEYAYNDWCILQMNILVGKEIVKKRLPGTAYMLAMAPLDRDFKIYRERARHFENLYDKRTGFFRPKKNGAFVAPFGPSEVNFAFTEGNSWQYSFFVPHDVSRLMELRGGNAKFAAWLDELFNTEEKLTGREQADLTGLIGQYAHGNEPSHHIAYLYNYAGEPWKTQKYVRKIMDEFYRNSPDGLIGNEDCGQMSAWYIMSALGFYQVDPGGTDYAIGSPLFPKAVIRPENGKTFTITSGVKSSAPSRTYENEVRLAPRPAIYISSAKLNGRQHRKSFITHTDLMRGGNLDFEMSSTPSERAFTEAPVSKIDIETAVIPVVDAPRTFANATAVRFEVPDLESVYYTTDGTEPTVKSTKYTGAIVIDRTTHFKAIAVTDSGVVSPVVESVITRRPNDWTAKVTSGYSTQYTGGGDNGIIDGIRGTVNFASGEWQGVQGKTYEAVIDMQKKTVVGEVGGSFLQVVRSWIWIPMRITFETSEDGVNFTQIVDKTHDISTQNMEPRKQEFRIGITPTQTRYIRVRAYNIGKIPSWHPGAGGDPWIFVDEIFIK